MMRNILFALILAVAPVTALAADAPACPAKSDMPEPWLTWASPAKAQAGRDVTTATPVPLARAVEATLSPVAQVQYVLPPTKPPIPNSYGGLFRVNIAYASRVGIALSGPAWVDMIEDGAVVATAEHGHGAPCTGMRKIVWFDVKPGAHIVQIANAPASTIRIMTAELSGRH